MNLTNQLLTALGEQLDLLIKVTAGDSSPVKPWPRPESAIMRAKQRQRARRHHSLVDEANQAMSRWDALHSKEETDA